MKYLKKLSFAFVIVLSLSLVVPQVILPTAITSEAATVKINKKQLNLIVGKSAQLKIGGTKKPVKWTSSKKSVATVNSKGIVTGKSVGITNITATVNKKKYICKVTVKHEFSDGEYKVGKDIQSGEYVVFSNDKLGGYYEINKDSTGNLNSIISNGTFVYNDIISVKDGQYLELSRCYAVPVEKAKIDTSKSGTFKVGLHIAPGEYKIASTSEISAYIEVTDSPHNGKEYIITNDIFNGSKYVTVEEDQYLTISRGKIEQ